MHYHLCDQIMLLLVFHLLQITENGQMQLTFDYTINDSHKRTTYFAFCFPFSYTECQQMLNRLDQQFVPGQREGSTSPLPPPETIYYHRSLLCHSLEGRRVDLLTVSSHHGIMEEEEDRLEGLFPDQAVHQARKFADKKVRIEGLHVVTISQTCTLLISHSISCVVYVSFLPLLWCLPLCVHVYITLLPQCFMWT